MSPRFPFLDHDGVLAFSHRGGTSDWPENTMQAFQRSIDLGYVYLETDVHLSSDGVLYAFHDANLYARTGVYANIADLTAAEIDDLLVDGRARIPRLEEVLLTWPTARVNIDTKSDETVLPLIDLVRRHNVLDRICIGSFVDRRIRKCRAELGPDLCTSMGQFEAARLVLASKRLADPSHLRAPCAQLPLRHFVSVASESLISFARELDIQVHIWTINDVETMHQLVDAGADGIMSDEPHILRDVLVERGAWTGRRTRSTHLPKNQMAQEQELP